MKHVEIGDASRFEVQICELGHHNPPDFPRCRVCGGTLGAPMLVAVPQLGWVRAADGQMRPLQGDIVVGRAPETGGIPGVTALETPPRLLEISRQHLRIHQNGWEISVIDLGSGNGTLLRRADGSLLELVAGRAYNVQPGDVLELAPEYTLKFEA